MLDVIVWSLLSVAAFFFLVVMFKPKSESDVENKYFIHTEPNHFKLVTKDEYEAMISSKNNN